jgi:lipopolysaccharide transport system ATP-binding protein
MFMEGQSSRSPSDCIAIRVSGVSKRYHLYEKPQDRLRQAIYPRLQRMFGRPIRSYADEFWALKNISLEVKKGETLGIIGRNGSGKSTLLQIIAGTLDATVGDVRVCGRLAALLELGSGFNPEFTGRENVYLNATILGLSNEEVSARFDDIASFADIGEYMDQPVKLYSSGMVVRLAFAVVAHVDADILVVDEALSVGDVFFSQKCMRFFERYQSDGGTVLFVSHDMAAVGRLCQQAILLVHGEVGQAGSTDMICKTYLEQLYGERVQNVPNSGDENGLLAFSPERMSDALEFLVPKQNPNQIFVSKFNATGPSFGIGGARITDVGFFDTEGRRLSELLSGDAVRFSIILKSEKHIRFPAVGLVLKDRLGQAVFTESTTWAFDGQYGDGKLEFFPSDVVRVDFDCKMPILFEGVYAITVAVAEGYGHEHVQHHLIHEALILESRGRRVLHGISGFDDLKLTIRVSRKASAFLLG